MKTRIRKWGNSLALRIPKAFADETGLKGEAPVELSVVDGKLVVTATSTKRHHLSRLLSKVTPENVHSEVDTGASVGRERW